MKHFDKVEYEVADDSQTPIMPFIAELREFKEQNPAEYERLLNIQKKVISFAQNEQGLSFASLHEKNKNQKLLRTFLYIANVEGNTRSVSQLEFFEELKSLCHAEEANATEASRCFAFAQHDRRKSF